MTARPAPLAGLQIAGPALQRRLAGAVSLARLWHQGILRARTRRALTRLDAHLLRDIGLTAEAAAQEAARPFWRD